MHKIAKICHFANDIFCQSASYIPAHNARNERSAVHGQGQEARDFKFHSNFSFNIAVLHPLQNSILAQSVRILEVKRNFNEALSMQFQLKYKASNSCQRSEAQ